MYFSKFPTYIATIGNAQLNIEDIFTRIVVGKTYSEISTLLIPYIVPEGETIEQLADKYYGSPFYHWVIILINNMIDPREEWPASEKVLYEKLFEKYEYTVVTTATAPFSVGNIVTTAENASFIVTGKEGTTLKLKYKTGNKYLTQNSLLYHETQSSTINSVIDPTEDIHHYENLSGIEVDYDANLLGQGLIVAVTNYDYENAANENKRVVRLLNKKYLYDFVKNLEAEATL